MSRADLKKWLETRYEKNPNTLLFARLADVYIREGRVDEAIEICLKGIQANPSYVTGNFILGKAYLAKGEFPKAELEFKKVLAYDRQFPAAHKYLGDLMIRMGYESKAHIHHRDLWHLDPLEETAASLVRKNHEHPDETIIEVSEPAGPSAPPWKPAVEEKINWKKELESIFPENRPSRTPPALPEKPPVQTPCPEPPPEPIAESREFSFPLEEITELSKPVPEIQPEPLPEFFETTGETDDGTPLGTSEATLEAGIPFVSSEFISERGIKSPQGKSDFLESDAVAESLDGTPVNVDPADQQPLIADADEIPDPSVEFDQESTDLLTDEKIVSPTLGEIYAAQGQHAKALSIFETLLKRTPSDLKLKKKIEELKKKMSPSG